jgi:phosphoenolpyruvate synthase/pyruvate phosphate dikinase
MYKPFSQQKNIEKMVREIVVFLEEETLQVNMCDYNADIHGLPNAPDNWVKYISTESDNPREIYLYWDRKLEDEFLWLVAEKLNSEEGYFDRLDQYFLDSYASFKYLADDFFNRGRPFYQQQTSENLIKMFHELNTLNKEALFAYYVVYDFSNILPRMVKNEILKQEPSEQIVDEDLFKISTMGISTIVKIERINFLDSLKLIQKEIYAGKNWNDKKINDIIFKHWYDFGDCCYRHTDNKNYTFEDYKIKFRKNAELDTSKELEEIDLQEKREREIFTELQEKHTSDDSLLELIGWLRKMIGYRNLEAEYYDAYFAHCMDFFEEIAQRLGIDTDNDIWLLSKDEIINGLLGQDTRQVVKERKKKGFTIKQIGSEIKVWTGVNKEDWHEEECEAVDEIKGNIAYQGFAKGKVRVILSARESGEKFKKDEILVTSMTTPDFVPLIKRAKAVVTDEGGILCHAAIVARELTTPCVIGTKIATKVLKDGDLVEVNADKGVVRAIK